MKKRKPKLLIALSAATVLVMGGIAMPKVIAATSTDAAFERQLATDLLAADQFTASQDAVTLQESEKANGVMVTGDAETLPDTVFRYGDTYDFGQETADYLIVDALAERKKNVQLELYVDDAASPFATVTLAKQKRKEIWSTVKNRCVNLEAAGITGTHTLSFRVIPAQGETGDVSFVMRSLTFMKSDIPMVDFDLDESQGTIAEMNGDSEHNTECYGNVTIRVPEGYQSEYSDKEYTTETYALDYIRGRGNSTWSAEKKPYKFKLDKKQDLLGMGKNKHWVLLANYYDVSMLRNKITYWLGEQLGMPFTPQCEFVNVVMNGEYLGSYYLSEQVRVGSSRVDIADLEENEETKNATDEATISGGYLLSMFPYGDEDGVTFSTEHDNQFLIESPSFEDYENEAQVKYISDYVQKTEDAIYGKDFKDGQGKSYAEYMDVDSAIDYYWVQEISMNGDAFGSTSTYLYKDRDGKLCWGPLWDFDFVAWGATEYNENLTSGFTQNRSTWFEQLLQDPEFYQKAVDRWPVIREKLLEAAKDGGQIDQYSAKQYESQKHNYEIWEKYSDGGGDWWWSWFMEDDDTDLEDDEVEVTYDSEVERLKSWIRERVEWIDGNLDRLQQSYYNVTFQVDGKDYAVCHAQEGERLEEFPEDPEKTGYTFDGWYVIYSDEDEQYEEELTAKSVIYQDVVAVAKWTKGVSQVAEIKEIGFLQDDIYMYMEDETDLQYCVLPFGAKDRGIEWTSDDPDVATVVDGTIFSGDMVGTATITAQAPNGVKKSCKVHVVSYMVDLDTAKIQFTSNQVTIEKGTYQRLPFEMKPKKSYLYSVGFASSDEKIVKVNDCGYISGEAAGSAVVVAIDGMDGSIQTCTVKVTDPAGNQVTDPGKQGTNQKQTEQKKPSDQTVAAKLKKGDIFTVKGITYKVLSVKKDKIKVACQSVKNKKSKKIEIPDTVTYQKQTCTVTAIDKKCFAKCKKLKRIILGNKITKIHAKAFKDCKNLKKVYVRSAKQKKLVKKALKNKKVMIYQSKKAKK
ncbi:MAG: CotH kinase family protein [Eubacteriales bacterium]|nr:CotH kinase family protein [Eubacteriales bacterium]